MTDTVLIKLYSARILALAADIPLNARLDAPQASVKIRAPLCGSTVTVDVVMQGGRIVEFGQDVKACALGQAAASLVGANIVGLNAQEIETYRGQLLAMLKDQGPVPSPPFDGFEVLLPARDFKNRHASIMLAFDAVTQAVKECTTSDCA